MAETPEGFNPEDYVMDQQTGGLREKEEQVSRKWRRDLEKRANAGDEARALLAKAHRELAVLKAGIPTDSPLGELFLKAYDGPDDADAIKQAAVRYGVLQPSPEQQQAIDQSLAGHQQAMQAAAGAQTQGGVDHQAAMRAIAAKHRGPGASEAAVAELKQYAQEHFGPGGIDALLGR